MNNLEKLLLKSEEEVCFSGISLDYKEEVKEVIEIPPSYERDNELYQLNELLYLVTLINQKTPSAEISKLIKRKPDHLRYNILYGLRALLSGNIIKIKLKNLVESPIEKLYGIFRIAFNTQEEMIKDYEARVKHFKKVVDIISF